MTGVGDQGEGLKTARPEIEVLGSADGTVWEPFVFREDFTKGTEQARQSARGAHGSLDMSAAAPAGPTDLAWAVQRLNQLANDHAGALGLGLAGAVVGGEVAKGLRRRRRAAGRPPKQKTQ